MKLLVDAGDLAGKRVFLRADLNVPIAAGVVTDPFRITRTIQTLLYLKDRGARTIIAAHLGNEGSLEPVADTLNAYLPVHFVRDTAGDEAHMAISAMADGDIILLENLRHDPGEKGNDPTFAQKLASLADVYVNDAFAASHRAHASIVELPKLLPSYAGLLFMDEYRHLKEALTPEQPSLVILGGAKFDTKEPLIKKLLDTYNHVFLAGALVNDALKAKGCEVGVSRISEHVPDASVLTHANLLLPSDVLVERQDGQARVRDIRAVLPDEKIVDIGPESFAALMPHIHAAQTILWNGPTGLYEDGYDDWTHVIAEALAGSRAKTIVGGGDTVAAIANAHVLQQFSFVSTAGGAMIEFLLSGTLPGIEALG